MTTVTSSRGAALLLGFGLLGLVGCSDSGSKVDVTGKITFASKDPNIQGLQIVFLCSDGTSVAAPIGANGNYQATGLAIGEAKVYFAALTQDQAEQAATVKGPRLQKPGGTPPPKVAVGNLPKANPLPAHLRDPISSKLMIQVLAGKPNSFDYDIK